MYSMSMMNKTNKGTLLSTSHFRVHIKISFFIYLTIVLRQQKLNIFQKQIQQNIMIELYYKYVYFIYIINGYMYFEFKFSLVKTCSFF